MDAIMSSKTMKTIILKCEDNSPLTILHARGIQNLSKIFFLMMFLERPETKKKPEFQVIVRK